MWKIRPLPSDRSVLFVMKRDPQPPGIYGKVFKMKNDESRFPASTKEDVKAF